MYTLLLSKFGLVINVMILESWKIIVMIQRRENITACKQKLKIKKAVEILIKGKKKAVAEEFEQTVNGIDFNALNLTGNDFIS